mgnify:FL=1|jgi:Peptidase propeptide and YPEB domain.
MMFGYFYGRHPYYSLWDDYWRIYRISSETAIQTALQQVPGQVIRIELDDEDGILVYEIHIRTPSGPASFQV